MNINEPRSSGFAIPGLTRKRVPGKPASIRSNRLPFLKHIPDAYRNHFVATSAEFTGTTLFLLFAFAGTQVALTGAVSQPNVVGAPSDPAMLLYIALSFGFSLAVNAWVFFRISGGLFNPAVTMGMALVGALPWWRALFLTIAQILGGITAAAICAAILPGELMVRTNLGGGTSIAQGLFIEMFLTAMLVFTIFMLAAEKHKGTFIAPIGIGLSLFIAELMGVYYTGGSVNPARSFGPSVVTHNFHDYHWIYWVGPILGSLLASGFYLFIKMLEYETANPGQDRAVEELPFDPNMDTTAPHVAFAPDEYAMEEGRESNATAVNSASTSAGNIGVPNEYGSKPRPYSDSPAPPHKNDQFAGLTEGGMHGNENPRSPFSNTNATTEQDGVVANPPRTALKQSRVPVGRNGTYSNGGSGQSASMNTYSNQQMQRGPADEAFYDNE